MVKGPTTQISPLKTRSKNYIGFTSASEAGFTTSKATGTGLLQCLTVSVNSYSKSETPGDQKSCVGWSK